MADKSQQGPKQVPSSNLNAPLYLKLQSKCIWAENMIVYLSVIMNNATMQKVTILLAATKFMMEKSTGWIKKKNLSLDVKLVHWTAMSWASVQYKYAILPV